MRHTVTVLAAFLALSSFEPALAQQRPPPPSQPTPGDGPNCKPFGELKADAIVSRIMVDGDGDWWLHIRFSGSGVMWMGYLSRATGKFCVLGEGRTNPEA